jgi:hypothetical protein
MNFFNEFGRRIPNEKSRVYNKKPSFYYKLNYSLINYENIFLNLKKNKMIDDYDDLNIFQKKIFDLFNSVKKDNNYSNLLKGIFLPFAYKNVNNTKDIGIDLIENLLPAINRSFSEKFPNSYFKAVHQGETEIEKNITLAEHSRYEELLKQSEINTVYGLYFPQALQEYDIESQINQMKELPFSNEFEICLSGGKDICASIVGSPEVMISDEFYSPVLCMTAYTHSDKRIILTLKSYGPHLEFWSMSQMLATGVTQVSEQWAGGITIFSKSR